MSEVWIADATPIIVLAKAGYLDLLTVPTREVLLPDRVVREVRKGQPDDPARLAVEGGWGRQVPVRYIPVAIRNVGTLGPGEQSVLALALKCSGSVVVLDDAKGRQAADALGIPKIGTLRVLMKAKEEGRLPTVVPAFHAVRAAGLYVGDALLEAPALTAGETWP